MTTEIITQTTWEGAKLSGNTQHKRRSERMNVLERLQERVLNKELDGTITNTEQLKLFVSGYLQGVYDQFHEDYFTLGDEDYKKIKDWAETYFKKPFYYTFGSFEGYPFQNGYIIIKAETIRQANYRFMQEYPNPRNEDVLNCSDYYDAKAWERILSEGYYKDQEPFLVIE